ncbi:MAG TPA: plastocyanin/azurin family copper-binding protein [Nitrososphaera sp.]|nr:plastocyanin/azurin family copper-binding protein [Nitrososphaera sp.]
MSDGIVLPVLLGLAVGIGFIVAMAVGVGGFDSHFGFYGTSGKTISTGTSDPDEDPVLGDFPGAVFANIRILEGSSLASNPPYLDPEATTVVIGVNNTVQWINEDTVPHNVVSDSGLFDSGEDLATGFIMPEGGYSFTFTEQGRYGYHGEPNPWIQGTIIVLPAQ